MVEEDGGGGGGSNIHLLPQQVQSDIDRNRTGLENSYQQLCVFDNAHVAQLFTATKIVATTILAASDERLKDIKVMTYPLQT